jgi:hypothetical protein
LGGCGHEGDQSISHGLLHGVGGCAIKGETVDHGADHDAAAHERADHVHHVLIVAPEPVDLADHERVARPEQIEQPATFWTIPKTRLDTRHAVIGHNGIDGKPAASACLRW